MDTKQLTVALEKLFEKENAQIVFWHDPEKEFLAHMNQELFELVDGVTTIRLDRTGALETKMRLEEGLATERFLVYSPTEEPDYDDDWLLDIRLFSRSFRADRASIILEELGLHSQHLRDHLTARRKFFDNKERLARLKTLVFPDDTADDLDRKMMAVVVKADQPELTSILRTLFHWHADSEDIDLREPIAAWDEIEKYDLSESFWRFIKKAFGYAEDSPSLENLLIRLMVTDIAQHLRTEPPAAYEHLLLPQSGRANAVVCLAQWRDSASRVGSYDRLSEYVANRVGLSEQLHNFEVEQLIDVQTFLAVEKEIASGLKDRLLSTRANVNVEDMRSIASRRQAGHWALPSVTGANSVPRKELHSVYEALVKAAEFFDLRNQHQHGFEFDSAADMYRAYESDLFRFDQLYRHFCELADKSLQWNVVKQLRDEVEAAYSNWYITAIGLSWGKFVEGDLLQTWRIPKVRNQFNFYENCVRPRLKEAENRTVTVIISDAFRYEAAKELTSELNSKYRFQAELSSQLSVLPSYTALGMASLLPHETLGYNKKGAVLVNGKTCSKTDDRDAILAKVGGMATDAKKLMAMSKEEGREHVAGKRVLYIYHDEIDSIGDTRSTEDRTFEAVRSAINSLSELVRFVVNSLNRNYVIITADHGFLFAESPPDETDKSKLADKPPGTVVSKKRFLLGHNLPDIDEAYHGTTRVSADAEGDMEFWLPKAANRFHFSGGSRFIHGGAMLQEVVVPVITVRHIKGKSKQETATKRVGVQVLGVNHRITTPKYRFKLLQTEPVSDRVRPITLKVAIYEGAEPITNIEKITFDSTSETMDDRSQEVVLVLEDRTYNKKTKYRLVLRDADTDIEQSSVNVIIDRAFTDDF